MSQVTHGGYLIGRAHRLSSALLDERLRAMGVDSLRGTQGAVFYSLLDTGGACLGEIAERTGCPKPTLTGVVDRMEAAGLVRREAVPSDRRKVRVVLADGAHAMAGAVASVTNEMDALFYRGFTSAEREEFESYLERVVCNLGRAAREDVRPSSDDPSQS